MNRFGVLLDMSNDMIIFRENLSQLSLSVFPPAEATPKPRILPRPRPSSDDYIRSIHSVEAASFSLLARRSQRDGTQLFAMSMEDLDREMSHNARSKLNPW